MQAQDDSFRVFDFRWVGRFGRQSLQFYFFPNIVIWFRPKVFCEVTSCFYERISKENLNFVKPYSSREYCENELALCVTMHRF